jgi:hypothetical protein
MIQVQLALRAAGMLGPSEMMIGRLNRVMLSMLLQGVVGG